MNEIYLYFEDWSEFSGRLERQGFPHRNKIIKVFAAFCDPKIELQNEKLKTVVGYAVPIPYRMKFEFQNGKIFYGKSIRGFLNKKKLPIPGEELAYALFHFSHEMGFMHNAMMLKVDGVDVNHHPMNVIDGFDHALRNPFSLHLDVFIPDSLDRLMEVVDYENRENLIWWKTGSSWRKSLFDNYPK